MGVTALWFIGLLVVIIDIAATVDVIRRPDLRGGVKVLWVLLRSGKGQFWKTSELVAKHSEAQTGCPITYIYSRRQGRALVERQGFRVAELWVDHIFPYRIRDYKEYRYRKEWYFRCLPGPIFRMLEERFGWHLCITAQPAGSSAMPLAA